MKKNISVEGSLSVGELAKRAGIAVSAIHFYEAKGLLVGWRTEGQQRRFPRSALRLIAIIKSAQNLGFSLEEIKSTLTGIPKNRMATQDEWEELALIWRSAIDERIAGLKSLRDHLDGCIGCGCLSVQDCPIRNANDRLAAKGPGAHLLK